MKLSYICAMDGLKSAIWSVMALAIAATVCQGAAAEKQATPTLVRAYAGLEAFARAVERTPAAREALFEQHAIAPFRRACGDAMGSFTHFPADLDAAKAREIVRAIDAAGVPRLVEEGFARASQALPGAGPLTVCLHAVPLNIALQHLRGVGGVSTGGVIKLFLHPTPHGFDRVRYVIAHEYHHEVGRLSLAPGWGLDPVQSVVAEGKADVFATSLYPRLRPAHTDPLAPDELRAVWAAFDRYRQEPSISFRSDFMFGLAPGMPRWAGYRLGFSLVSRFVQANPAMSTADWTRADANVILRQAR